MYKFKYLKISIGSCYKIDTQLVNASDLKFVSENELHEPSTELNEIVKMVSKFKSTLKI